MIPEFDRQGYLPPGIHPATIEEIVQRFGRQSELRRMQMESLRWLVDMARRAGVVRFAINGSYVTDVLEPNDVDCVLLVVKNTLKDRKAIREIRRGLPFLDIEIVNQKGWKTYLENIYATDRFGVPKGVVEVIL